MLQAAKAILILRWQFSAGFMLLNSFPLHRPQSFKAPLRTLTISVMLSSKAYQAASVLKRPI